ncbi:hypothetical protein L596_010283 [Steinernema carpocapsae]|uniref:LTD domain-containing protein n=1 Tax=Steinernema carpocapsae TaxID=34508 RepID=A0A4U5PJ71_STECR|nr:hypothetical protein L596_010283 [Steinernema carpocapsae]
MQSAFFASSAAASAPPSTESQNGNEENHVNPHDAVLPANQRGHRQRLYVEHQHDVGAPVTHSPLPPARKGATFGLNNRLAQYIERVRSLESQNNQLKMQIRDVEVVERKERNDLIERYQEKVDELRKTLEDICGEKTRLEIERSKAVEGYDEVKNRVAKLERDLQFADRERLNCQSLVQDLQARLNTAENRRKHHEDENLLLKAENAELKKQLETLRSEIEDEAVLRTSLENKMITLKEDLDFARKTHSTQMDDVKRKRQVEMTSVSSEIEHRYQAQLQEQLQAMRAEFDARIGMNRREIDMMVSQRDEKISMLEAEIARMISEYRDLMDLKVQLDVELQAYQKLLEGEETRLHLSPSGSLNVSQEDLASGDASMNASMRNMAAGGASAASVSAFLESASRGLKRKRISNSNMDYSFDHSTKRFRCSAFADGDIAIDEVDTDGRHVRLKNKGEEDVSIGGWKVKSIGGGQEVVYKFHPRQMLKAGETITIWSKDSGEKHEPPHSLVMKNQIWPTGEDLRTGIQDTEGKTVAGMENVLEYGSRTMDNGNDPDQRCSIM